MFLIWSEFAFYLLIILAAGSQLSRYGDAIAEKTGLGRTWIGAILLATVTSLPELFTGVSAITLTDTPDITMGDLMGSCVFNLSLIVILDLMHRKGTIYTRAGQGHLLSAGLGLTAISFTGFSILVHAAGHAPSIGHVGLSGLLLLFFYPFAARSIYRFESRRIADSAEESTEVYKTLTLKTAIVGYSVAAIIVVGAALRLPYIGQSISAAMGWNMTFVGTLFIAFATSVPELVVTISAVRLGALDLAIGNILGSNIFNIWVIGVLDVLYTKGPILSDISPLHATTAFSAVMMSGLMIVGLMYRPRNRVGRTVAWVSLLIFAIFLMNSFILYLSNE